MKLNAIAIMTITVCILVFSGKTTALTMSQFNEICDSSETKCSNHPLLQTYVGGALDLIAVLDEETDYLGTVYCDKPETLFNVSAIIDFMLKHQKNYSDRNAMLLVVRYLEENSGC